jgi:hypothetical protein
MTIVAILLGVATGVAIAVLMVKAAIAGPVHLYGSD